MPTFLNASTAVNLDCRALTASSFTGSVSSVERETQQPPPQEEPQEEPQEQLQKKTRWRALWMWTKFGEKSGWDWMQLLIIPVVLALGGLLFSLAQDARQQEAEERRAQAQRDAEEQRAQDELLRAYFEEMGNLLLDEDLRTSQKDDEASTLARARTLTILGRVDPKRKRGVVSFLYEAKLIRKPQPIVSLASADLSDADLTDADLEEAYLEDAHLEDAHLAEANLIKAALRRANLGGADLSDASLLETDLRDADLRDADLSDARPRQADLRHADLGGADLGGADLSFADLKNADLRDADLSGAALSKADLRHADLGGADLREIKGVTAEDLEQAADSLLEATMPDGSKHD